MTTTCPGFKQVSVGSRDGLRSFVSSVCLVVARRRSWSGAAARPIRRRPARVAKPIPSGREVALRGAGIDGVGADQPVRAGLLEDVGRPAGMAGGGGGRRGGG